MSFASAASSPQDGWRATAALALLVVAVGYNLPLSILNAHVFAVSRNALIGVEALLIGAALLLVVTQWRAGMTRWVLMILAFVALSLLLSLGRQSFDPKSLRDMVMIATFIMLGMTVPETSARRAFVGLQLVLTAIMLFEVTLPEIWAGIVDSRSYFIATRGFNEEQFYGDLALFGATRPDERYYLPVLGWIRASSLFLEPLSLGNYCGFALLMILVFWRDWDWRTRAVVLITWAILLVGSDSRFAGISAVALLVAAPVMMRLPVVAALLYLPLAVAGARVASRVLAWDPLIDDFPGRIARGMKQLFALDPMQLAGFETPTAALADSGMAYLVMSQSLAGVVLFQLFLYVSFTPAGPRQRLMWHGAAISFAMSILVSVSMMSIKTAALFWFFAGVMLVRPGRPAA